ncbi:hypothetical protein Trco_001685 [Trichoderma cornu-damae]|uniref:Uncharacterized protein n=1 Tax=Trichoderma cornu-damae TaxID=654480 RepID=A0A9P8QNG2_9HYPO|nr:hypothetical protein Trco_001685 [Trichoderma cornu-damae]
MNVTGSTTHDAISISSSDNDSDCRIVKVVPSTARRGKNKMRWQYQPATSGDAAGKGRFQSANRGVESLGSGSGVHRSSAAGLDGNETSGSAMVQVELTDPCSIQQDTVDLEQMSTPSALPTQRAGSQQAPQGADDERFDIRVRSCSTATLTFALEGAAAQRRGSEGVERVVRGTIGVHEEPPKPLPPPFTNSVVPRGSNDSTPSPGPVLGESNQAVIKDEFREASSKGNTIGNAQDLATSLETGSSPIPQGHISPSRQRQYAAVRARRRLPRVGKWRAWSSAINFAAFEALPGPLFTLPKEALHPVTYNGIVKERAEKEAKRRRRREVVG